MPASERLQLQFQDILLPVAMCDRVAPRGGEILPPGLGNPGESCSWHNICRWLKDTSPAIQTCIRFQLCKMLRVRQALSVLRYLLPTIQRLRQQLIPRSRVRIPPQPRTYPIIWVGRCSVEEPKTMSLDTIPPLSR